MLRRDAKQQQQQQLPNKQSYIIPKSSLCTHGKLCLYIFTMLTIFVLLSFVVDDNDTENAASFFFILLFCYQHTLSHMRGAIFFYKEGRVNLHNSTQRCVFTYTSYSLALATPKKSIVVKCEHNCRKTSSTIKFFN